MQPTTYIIHKMVKGEDLNHHGTLYAGRSAEWFVEAGFIAAASLTDPKNIVCLKIHSMTFTRPVKPGSIVRYEGTIVLTGRTRLVAFVQAFYQDEPALSGFLTFVHVDADGRAVPHGVEVTPVTERERALHEQAGQL